VTDPEFYNGEWTVDGRGLERELCPSPEKMNFYPKKVDFGAF